MNTCYTIGYGGWAAQNFLDTLTAHRITTIVDVRLQPTRAYMGTWVKAKTPDKGIERLLASEHINYAWIPELGNLYKDEKNWRELYAQHIRQQGDQLIKSLLEIPQPFAIMCAERRVTDCHREYIAQYLEGMGWAVTHL